MITIRKSVGYVRKTKQNIWLYAVLSNGHTVGHFTSSEDAERYAHDLQTRIVTKYHAR